MGEDEKRATVTAELPPGAAKGAIRDNAEVICFAVMLILFYKTFVGQQFTIPSASMRDTLMIGDHLLANKFLFAQPQWAWETQLFPIRAVRRGDIIVFRYPLSREQDYVKRCVAVAGDRVELRNKRLYVNGKLITGTFEYHRTNFEILDHDEDGQPIYKYPPEPGPWPLDRDAGISQYQEAIQFAETMGSLPDAPVVWPYNPEAFPDTVRANREGRSSLGGYSHFFYYRDDITPFVVPQGQVMAMGDNRDNSADSRYWGFVPVDHLRGKPFMVWWSFRERGNDDSNAKVPKDPSEVLSNLYDGARYFFARTRWKRTGTMPK